MKLHVNSRIENNTIKIYRFGDDMSLFSNANEKRLFLIKIEKKKLSLLIIYARSRRDVRFPLSCARLYIEIKLVVLLD